MKTISLATAALAMLALGACDRGKQEQLGNDVELNAAPAEDLNALSDQAAEVAAEAEALQNQAAELEQQGSNMTENATGPETPEDENIQGM